MWFTMKCPAKQISTSTALAAQPAPSKQASVLLLCHRKTCAPTTESSRTLRMVRMPASNHWLSGSTRQPERQSHISYPGCNSGQDLPSFPIELSFMTGIKARAKLAGRIDKKQQNMRKDQDTQNWFSKAAEELDMELDDELKAGEEDSTQRSKQQKELAGMKAELKGLLAQPITKSKFAGGRRFVTTSAQGLPSAVALQTGFANDQTLAS
eukprot:m.290970 g.290970  ORF g.290970 m.290970 type:complete len:210 (-) comp19473_c0_seq3:90-719(-)